MEKRGADRTRHLNAKGGFSGCKKKKKTDGAKRYGPRKENPRNDPISGGGGKGKTKIQPGNIHTPVRKKGKKSSFLGEKKKVCGSRRKRDVPASQKKKENDEKPG